MSIVTQEQLAEAMKLPANEKTRIEKRCRAQGIRVFHGKGCIWTTIGLIERAAVESGNDEEAIEF